MIEQLNINDFPDTDLAHDWNVKDKYIDTHLVPKASPDNFKILIDKMNNLIEIINNIQIMNDYIMRTLDAEFTLDIGMNG